MCKIFLTTQINVSTHQSSVFISGILMLQPCALHILGTASFINKVGIPVQFCRNTTHLKVEHSSGLSMMDVISIRNTMTHMNTVRYQATSLANAIVSCDAVAIAMVSG